jgi:hypothetical protein
VSSASADVSRIPPLGRADGESADEDAELGERPSFGLAEELPGSVEDAREARVTLWVAACTRREHRERTREAHEQLVRREQREPGRRHFERERNAVEEGHELSCDHALGFGELGPHRTDSVLEEAERGLAFERRQAVHGLPGETEANA